MKLARLAYVLLPMLASCNSGGGSDGGTIVTPTPSPAPSASPSPSPSPSPAPAPTPTPVPTTWAGQVDALYATAPDIPACRTGTMAPAVMTEVLAQLNALRALHRLPPVTLSSTDQQSAMEAALMMAANGQLSHEPPTTWKCYTALGAAGARSGNLYGNTLSPYLTFTSNDGYLAGWMTEVNNLIANNVGHRRWILNPFLNTVAYGRIAGMADATNRADAAVMKMFNNAGQSAIPTGLPSFVAYPYGDYPARYFDTRALLSFSAIADARQTFGANERVDFSRATITITAASGGALAIGNVSYDNVGYGLPNNLQFTAANIQPGVNYTVAIDGVIVRGASTNYTYDFRIVN